MRGAKWSLVACLTLAACGPVVEATPLQRTGTADAGTPPVTGTVTGLPCDVGATIAHHCGTCHGSSPRFGATMPLASVEDFHAPAQSDPSRRAYELVARRIHDDAKPMPPPPNARLTANELSPLDAWLAAGAPTSTAACGERSDGGGGGGDAAVVTNPLACKPDLKLRPSAKWSMPAAADDVYICYGVDVPLGGKRHLIGFSPSVDNAKIVHHLALFESNTSVSSTPFGCSLTGQGSGRLIYGWAPGGGALELPEAAGFPEEGTAHFVVQVHYNNVRALVGEEDASGIDVCSTSQLRPSDADLMVFGTFDISIPPRGSLDLTCDFTFASGIPMPVSVFSAMPHMHKLGKHISSTLFPNGGGAPREVVSVPAWDFTTQPWTPAKTVLHSGDTVRTRCAWNNPGDQTIRFGEGTGDEMCGVGLMYYPRITSSGWQMATPILNGTCHPTP